MEYKLPPLPEGDVSTDYHIDGFSEPAWTEKQMRQYAEQAVAPLLAEIERLEKENKIFERALYRIAVVRAMDYEYRTWANTALLGLDVVKE